MTPTQQLVTILVPTLIPTFAVIVALIANKHDAALSSARLAAIESRLGKMDALDARMSSVELRMKSVDDHLISIESDLRGFFQARLSR